MQPFSPNIEPVLNGVHRNGSADGGEGRPGPPPPLGPPRPRPPEEEGQRRQPPRGRGAAPGRRQPGPKRLRRRQGQALRPEGEQALEPESGGHLVGPRVPAGGARPLPVRVPPGPLRPRQLPPPGLGRGGDPRGGERVPPVSVLGVGGGEHDSGGERRVRHAGRDGDAGRGGASGLQPRRRARPAELPERRVPAHVHAPRGQPRRAGGGGRGRGRGEAGEGRQEAPQQVPEEGPESFTSLQEDGRQEEEVRGGHER